jgi:hypothetical protein
MTARLTAIATVLVCMFKGCAEDSSGRSKAVAVWASHMAIIDREIAILSRVDSQETPPTQEELAGALEFFYALTGIRAQVALTPMGPVAELHDYVIAKERWERWRVEHDIIFDERTQRVRSLRLTAVGRPTRYIVTLR